MKQHPCHGQIDVSAATCYDFKDAWENRSGAPGLLRMRGLSYGRAFLELYLPDIVDEELAQADDIRAHQITILRYMAH